MYLLSALEVSSSFHLFFSKPTFLVDSLDSHWLCLDYHTIIHLLPTTYYTVYNMHSVQILLPGWHYICQNVYNRVHCIGCYFPYCNVFALPSNFRWWMKLPAMLNNINSINCFKKKNSTHSLIELPKVKIKNDKWTTFMELNSHIIIMRSWGQLVWIWYCLKCL